MSNNNRGDPLRIRVLGMDSRSLSTFKMFLQGPCKNQAVSVNDQSAEICLIDMDGLNALNLYTREREQIPDRPVIVTSLRDPDLCGTIYVSKPIKAPGMLSAIEEARKILACPDLLPHKPQEMYRGPEPEKDRDDRDRDCTVTVRRKKPRGYPHHRRSAHRAAMLLDERAYSTYVGAVADIDINDPHQVAKARYDTRKYLQAYVESAVKLARTRKRILQLNCGWKPITIFPHSNEIWIDAEDRQIRSFCVVPINSISNLDVYGANEYPRSIISPVSPDQTNGNRDPKKFQPIDPFIWKIALWTSNGRIPDGIRLDQPVYLDRWPNLSRFVVPPHSLRIAALMIDHPMTLLEVAAALRIRQQYVFSFFSAAMALGLAGQSPGQKNLAGANPSRIEQQRSGLLQRLLHRLKVG